MWSPNLSSQSLINVSNLHNCNSNRMNFQVNELYGLKEEDLKEKLTKNEVYEISFWLSSIGFTNNPIDIVQDYATISYCCENIVPFITILKSDFVTRDKYYQDFKITCKSQDIGNLANTLIYYAEMLTEELKIYDDIDVISFYDNICEYQNQLNKKRFAFPELINNYWANLLNGGYYQIASEEDGPENVFFQKVYRKYPEHRYGFWKGALSKDFIEPIYFSIHNWIIPPTSDTIKALKIYSDVEYLNLYDAEKIEYNSKIILISNSAAIYFDQYNDYMNSLNCIKFALDKKTTKQKIKENEYNLFEENIISKSKNPNLRYYTNNEIKYKLSEFGDILAIEQYGYTFIFFNKKFLNFEEIKDLHSYLYPTFSKVQNLINNSISENCNWNQLNSELFEDLCYDILYCHPSFDSSTIQRMGKTKSRDGGRDIVIKTRRTISNEPELYVFQCKFYSDKYSLSASKLSNAANVIMQYGAKGYGVFTTTTIDATLYDMLNGFHINSGIDVAFCWSKYELERYINIYPAIRNKYFQLSTNPPKG